MRCKLCPPSERRPVVYAPLRFCKEHFLAYYEKKIREYFESTHVRNAKVLVAVSGGKDSAALADALLRIGPQLGLEIALFTIDLAIPDYSDKGLEAVKELSAKYGVELIIEDLRNHPHQIPFYAGPGTKPCGACGAIKRYLLNKTAVERGYAYIATGHNLDDEFYFAMHSLVNRDTAQLRRSAKMLPPKPDQKLAGRLKPLYYLTEKENRLYCLLQGIPHDADECPFSVDNPQVAFKAGIGAQLSRDDKRNLLKSLRDLQEPVEAIALGEGRGELHACARCGYPTTSEKSCSFCALMARGE